MNHGTVNVCVCVSVSVSAFVCVCVCVGGGGGSDHSPSLKEYNTGIVNEFYIPILSSTCITIIKLTTAMQRHVHL